MNIALDIGCHEIRALRFEEGELRARRCRSLALFLENSETQRATLEQLKVPYTEMNERLALFGEAAERIGLMFHRPVVPLLPGGRLADAEVSSRRLLAAIIESLVGRARGIGDSCAMTLPGVIKSGSSLEAEEKRFFLQTTKRLGYTPLVMSAPLCLALAELESSRFTGIAASFGAATAEMSLVFHGREIARSINPNAGTWIDQRLARLNEQFQWDAQGHRFVDAERTRGWKERFAGSIAEPVDDASQQLRDVCRGMIEYLLRNAADSFRRAAEMQGINEPIPFVAAGGSAKFGGFRDVLQQSIEANGFPVAISDVRVATKSDLTIARGGLIQAELESPASGGGANAAA